METGCDVLEPRMETGGSTGGKIVINNRNVVV